MEGYTFVDIFATKNIDYLLALVSILLLIPFWKMMRDDDKKTVKDKH